MRKALGALGLLLAASPAAWSQTWDLDTVTVTGTKVEKRLADTPVPTEIITADEIKATGATDLRGVLTSYGVITDSDESHGDQISLDGLSGGRVLILVDGRRIPGRVAQNVEGDSLPLANVDRIEIVRGPQSALYGSDAMGGVINIITRRPTEAKFHVQVDNASLPAYDDPDVAGTGTTGPAFFQQQNLQLGLDVPLGDWWTSLNVSGTHSDYYWNQTGDVSVLPRTWRGSFSFEADHGTPATGAWTLGASATGIDQTDQTDFTGGLNQRDLQRYETYAKYRTENGTGESWEFQVHQHLYRRDTGTYVGDTKVWTYDDPTLESLTGLEAWHTRDLTPSNLLTLGIQTTVDALHAADLSGGPVIWTDNEAVIVQDEQYQDGLYSVITGLRIEHGAGFGFFAAPKIAAQYTLLPGLRALGGVGIGYRVPSVEDRYYDIDWSWHPIVLGNLNLKPEYSVAANAGADWAPNDRFSARLNAYHQELTDEITYIQTGTAADGRAIYTNENRARTFRSGVDAEVSVSPLAGWTVDASYGWLLAWDRESNTAITDDPAHRVRGSVSYANRPWGLSARADGQWDSNRRLFILGAGVSQDWKNGVGVYARGDNLTSAIDKAKGPFSPASLTLGLRYQS
jgi:outer membrane receptor for ferrienterochelin and colicins